MGISGAVVASGLGRGNSQCRGPEAGADGDVRECGGGQDSWSAVSQGERDGRLGAGHVALTPQDTEMDFNRAGRRR